MGQERTAGAGGGGATHSMLGHGMAGEGWLDGLVSIETLVGWCWPSVKPVGMRNLMMKRKHVQMMHLIVLIVWRMMTISWVVIITMPDMPVTMAGMAGVAMRREGIESRWL